MLSTIEISLIEMVVNVVINSNDKKYYDNYHSQNTAATLNELL